MCSDPQTRIDRVTGVENEFACRKCNDCLATRRHGWVARAMAEKAESAHTVCVTLTYSDETQRGRDAAKLFAYADVMEFMKRLRSAAKYEAKKLHWNLDPSIRFVCAGEQGSENGRCHWHVILFTNFDVARIGKFRLRGQLVTHRRDMITVGKRKRRLNWNLWPWGYMTLQEPGEAGMKYVLSYCLKDQFTVEASEGTMREHKSEAFATGLFRMSKRPAIGSSWLMRKMEALDAQGAVLPSLNLKIPGMQGYWQPHGSFRKKLLWALVALNKRALWTRGGYAPQWSSLVAAAADNVADMEILAHGQVEKTEIADETSVDAQADRDQREVAERHRQREIRSRCGGPIPCEWCLAGFDDRQLSEVGLVREWRQFGENRPHEFYVAAPGWPEAGDRPRHAKGNPHCVAYDLPDRQRAFGRSSQAPY